MFSKRSIERLAGACLVTGLVAFLAHGLTLDQGVGRMTILLVLVYGFMIILCAGDAGGDCQTQALTGSQLPAGRSGSGA